MTRSRHANGIERFSISELVFGALICIRKLLEHPYDVDVSETEPLGPTDGDIAALAAILLVYFLGYFDPAASRAVPRQWIVRVVHRSHTVQRFGAPVQNFANVVASPPWENHAVLFSDRLESNRKQVLFCVVIPSNVVNFAKILNF